MIELRPLGFGEIFDRAVTLYVKNFVPFVALVLVLVVPLAILQYVYAKNTQPEFDFFLNVFRHPGGPPPAHVPTVLDSPPALAALGAMALFGYFLWPFALNAVAVGVARLYRGRAVEFAPCYAAVLHRWLAIIAVMGIEILIGLAWYFLVVLLVFIIVMLVILAGAIAPAFAFVTGFIGGVIGVLVMLPLLAPLLIALTFAMYGVVIEELRVGDAIALGFARVFNKTEFWRAMLFAIAAFAVVVGGSTIFSILSMLAAFAHQPALESIIDSLSRAAIAPFGVVLMAIYYFDVRIRREGYDLEASLARLAGEAPA